MSNEFNAYKTFNFKILPIARFSFVLLIKHHFASRKAFSKLMTLERLSIHLKFIIKSTGVEKCNEMIIALITCRKHSHKYS